jgi:prepilin-type N-terminal cleavage/methylation domain-containing protein
MKKAYTVIEIMVILSIIGILLSIAFSAFNEYRHNNRSENSVIESPLN